VPASSRAGADVVRIDDAFLGRFMAFGGPCDVLIDTDDRAEAETAITVVQREASRIEHAFSRYRTDNIVHRINHAEGASIIVDEETALLLDYAATCHEVSGGLFDITSGVLRRAWTFDGGDRVPSREALARLLPLVGWHRARWQRPRLTLPAGTQIDFGGIGKEYAVDRAAAQIGNATPRAALVNFGGDLYATGLRRRDRPWSVGLDDPARSGEATLDRFELERGGMATSGDARRFVMHEGRRLGHILNPRTGWPIEGAPRSITVVGPTCLEAGTLATLAYLQGPNARAFLTEHGAEFRIVD
jgi:thiamine biosynthesis lipoprotein